jgi:hypothetical protein
VIAKQTGMESTRERGKQRTSSAAGWRPGLCSAAVAGGEGEGRHGCELAVVARVAQNPNWAGFYGAGKGSVHG